MYTLYKKTGEMPVEISQCDTLQALVNAAGHYVALHGETPFIVVENKRLMFEDICDRMVTTFGAEKQEWVFVGEVGELLDALADFRRGRCDGWHIAEEIADVEITLQQVKSIYDVAEFVEVWREKKIAALRKKLEGRV